MKLTVKTLKGGKFEIDVQESQTVAQVKGLIQSLKSEIPAASTKLIHSGKVLKDEETLAACGVKANDFLVVMVTKAKKGPPAKAPPAATEDVAKAPAVETPSEEASAPAADPQVATTPAPPAAASSTPSSPPAAPSRLADPFPEEAVTNLMAMGFPEAEVRHCLRVAHGNPDMAVEFLTNGIPDGVAQAASVMQASPTPGSPAGQQPPLQALRNHPQFNDLRRLVQSNPQMLQQVLTQIGQQQPELLREINENQQLFLQMMNEPVVDSPVPSSIQSNTAGANSGSSSPPLPRGMGSPSQMAQMLQNMSPEELNRMAAMMGLSPEQVRSTMQLIGQMPPEQLSQFMLQAVGGGGGGGMGGQQVVELTQEEMEAVDRLTEMGFDRSEAAQAFLACDKNEALAANLLMDSMGDGGLFGDDSNDNNDNNNNGAGDDGNDDDDDMYD